ncbi:MAG TPA: hypothetical protein ENO19_01900, partial [Halothiobacillaceae bacterium]|nr:hypothetical protein [Halothiobacillaceae bacterium]
MHVAGWASREPRRRGDVTGRQRAARSPGRWSWRLVAWSVFVACLVVGSPFPSAGHAGERPLARAQWATTTQSLSPAEALDLDFRAMSGDTLNLGPFQGDIWLRLWLDGSEMGERRWLSVRWPYARDFRFYLVGSRSADGKPSLLEWREGAHPIGLPAIPTDPGRLLPAFDGKRQFLLRLSADGPTAMQLTLDSVQTERNRLLSRYLLFGIYLGAMLGMATYSLFLMLALRERTYAGYAAFLAATVLYVGLRYNVLGPLLPEFLHWMSPARQAQLAVALMALSGIGFVRRFLQSPRDDPRADRVLQLLMLLALSTVPASAALSGELSSLLVMGMVVATVLGIFWAAWRSMGRGFRPAFNLLISWSMFAVVVLLYLAMLLGVLPYSAVLTLGLPLGSLALALLLAFALGSRIRHKQREEAALERDRDRYRFLSERDGLTGLYN